MNICISCVFVSFNVGEMERDDDERKQEGKSRMRS